MISLAAAFFAVALGVAIYALWPKGSQGYIYSVGEDGNPLTTLYRRSANGWYERWSQRYSYTGGKPRGKHTIGNIVLVIAGVVFIAALILTRSAFISVIPTIAAVVMPWLFFGLQSRKREQVITTQLVDFLDTVRGALETHTLTDAVRIAATSVDAPLSHELSSVVADLDSRVDLSTALRNLAERNSSRVMAFTCATLDIANKTGSVEVNRNLAELSKLIRDNERTSQDIKNKTLILRVSAKMFIIIPTLGLLLSFAAFGVEPWITPLGFAGIAFIVIVGIGASVGFSKLQQWQVGG